MYKSDQSRKSKRELYANSGKRTRTMSLRKRTHNVGKTIIARDQ